MKSRVDLSPTDQDYLKVIWGAGEWSDEPVTIKAVAARLGISPSTVSEGVKKLTQQGLLDHAPYGSIELTELGSFEARRMVRRHRLLETFLQELLGYGWDEVHAEADQLEHAVSDTFVDAVDRLLAHPRRDPHGDPIPDRNGCLPHLPAVRLSESPLDQAMLVARVSDRDTSILRYLSNQGLHLDAEVEVRKRSASAGVITVAVDGRDVDLGLPAANSVWVVPA